MGAHDPPRKVCQDRSFKVLSWGRILLGYLVLLLSFRFGEATNPGPIIGSVNPTGLLGKAAIVHQLPFGVYSICESHLTAAGLCQFRKELAAQGNQMRYFSSSNAPLIRSAVGVIGGKSTGVGFLSNYPGRNLPTQWEHDVLQEARTHVSAFFVENVWVKCGVCYGYARHPTTLATRSKTDDLLAKVVQRIVFECTGPRIVMGDWNQHPGILPQELVLRQQGFVEIQQHMAAMQGREVSFTCKGASVKDFVWISPELIPYLHAVTVDNDLFADHAVLSAHFRSFGSFQTVPLCANLPHYPGKRSVTTTTRHAQSRLTQVTYNRPLLRLCMILNKVSMKICCLKTRQAFSLFIVVGVLLFHQLCVVSLSLLIRQLGITKLILPSWENIFNMCSG